MIALFQFLRAGVALCVAYCVWKFPDLYLDSHVEVKALTYLATQKAIPPTILAPVILPIFALYFAIVGIGLWRLQKWARIVLLSSTGLTAFLWIRRFAFDQILGDTTVKDQSALGLVYSVVLIDALIFCSLAFLPDVAEAFRVKDL
jgi:hypothetical protein